MKFILSCLVGLWVTSSAVASSVVAKTPPAVTIPYSQVHNLYSKSVEQDYELHIRLPVGYAETKQTYPVFYFLDSQWDFPLYSAIAGQSYFDGFIPQMILVGITWGGENADPNVLRVRDFTPSPASPSGKTGGAKNFLTFLQKELIPYIDANFNTSQQRILSGSSLGGLFTLYTLFTQPELFTGYLPTAPVVGWDNWALSNLKDGFGEKLNALPRVVRMYGAIGEHDELAKDFTLFQSMFDNSPFTGLDSRLEVIPGLGHASLKATAASLGLHYLFRKPKFIHDQEQMKAYLGHYRHGNEKLFVALKEGQLVVTYQGKRHNLLAHAKGAFHKHGEYFEVSFEHSDSLILKTFFDTLEFNRVY